jgi:hypothetical protein
MINPQRTYVIQPISPGFVSPYHLADLAQATYRHVV